MGKLNNIEIQEIIIVCFCTYSSFPDEGGMFTRKRYIKSFLMWDSFFARHQQHNWNIGRLTSRRL